MGTIDRLARTHPRQYRPQTYAFLMLTGLAITAWAGDMSVLRTYTTPTGQGVALFGSSVAGVGDLDGDGSPEILIGAEQDGPDGAGRAYVFSGRSGQLLLSLMSPNAQSGGNFGCGVSGFGDVDGDGVGDLLIGASQEDPGTSPDFAGRAYVFSGATGMALRTFQAPDETTSPRRRFGNDVADAGDVDRDGVSDALIGTGFAQPGKAYVFSGSTGDLIWEFGSPHEGSVSTTGFGRSVASLGDVDGDAVPDLLAGSYSEDVAENIEGRAYVFSGATGEVIHELASPFELYYGHFGDDVCGLDDVDGDGVPDLCIGAPYHTPAWGLYYAGAAYVFSGATGALIRELGPTSPQNGGQFGRKVAGMEDMDGDGVGDLAVTECRYANEGVGKIYVFSGATGALFGMARCPEPEFAPMFGMALAGVGDTDENGEVELLVGAFGEYPSAPQGRAFQFTPHIVLGGVVSGNQLTLSWTPVPAAATYWVYGASNEAYFAPGLVPPYAYRMLVVGSGTTSWSLPNGIGNPNAQWAYLVIAMNGSQQELNRSNRFGEWDTAWTIPWYR